MESHSVPCSPNCASPSCLQKHCSSFDFVVTALHPSCLNINLLRAVCLIQGDELLILTIPLVGRPQSSLTFAHICLILMFSTFPALHLACTIQNCQDRFENLAVQIEDLPGCQSGTFRLLKQNLASISPKLAKACRRARTPDPCIIAPCIQNSKIVSKSEESAKEPDTKAAEAGGDHEECAGKGWILP